MNAPPPVLTSRTSAADAFGDLLAHDRRRDQRNALDRAGDVAQGVQPPVGRGDLGGLADQRAADRLPRPRRNSSSDSAVRKPGIDSSLSSVPPVWPRPRPDIIGTDGAARDRQRREDQRRLVADAAGAVLVDRECRDWPSKLDADAGSHHRVGELRGLLGRHAAQHDGHQQRGGLVVGNGAVGDARDEIFDLAATERSAVALAADDVDRSHSGNNIRMTAPERGTATIAPDDRTPRRPVRARARCSMRRRRRCDRTRCRTSETDGRIHCSAGSSA